MAKPDKWDKHSVTAARQEITADNNDTLMNAYQFGKPEDFTWTLTGQDFECQIKRNSYDANPLLSLSTTDGSIVVDDVIQRVIHFYVPPAAIQASLSPGEYVYDFIMIETANPLVRIKLMYGPFTVVQGVTNIG